MKITFTGTGAGAGYDHDRGGASVMIEGEGGIILFDCGPGVMRQIHHAGLKVGDIKAIFISHLHFDHTVALPEFFNMLGRRSDDPPRIFGPVGIAEFVENAKKLIIISGIDGLPERLQELRGEQIEIGETYEIAGFKADAIEVPHDPLVQALSWRFRSDDRTVVVSGDLATNEAFMAPFAADADLLVHEAHTPEALDSMLSSLPDNGFRERAANGFHRVHSEVSAAAIVAEKARVKRLALTVILPTEDEGALVNSAKEHYTGDVFAAQTGESLEI
jgi:ribonuclease BN (tRNA processing enzyme)